MGLASVCSATEAEIDQAPLSTPAGSWSSTYPRRESPPAGQVKTATDEQSLAGRGITAALEKIAEDARAMRDLLDRQLSETDRIADASRTMLDIAQENDAIAREFNTTVQNLVRSGQEFESEVARFRG